jgi:hypothetical protein
MGAFFVQLEGWRDFDLEAGILRQPRRGKRLVSGLRIVTSTYEPLVEIAHHIHQD